jgi:V/A-type H+-transporting ATPase subunit E
MANAKAEIERMTKSSEDAIRQAGRNLLISFRESIARQLEAILGENVSKLYSSEEFIKVIVTVVENWASKPDADDITVILNEKDLSALEGSLLGTIKEKMLKGVTLKPSDSFDGGFRIAVNNGSVYYDYSVDAVVDMLSNYLSPKVVALLKEAE